VPAENHVSCTAIWSQGCGGIAGHHVNALLAAARTRATGGALAPLVTCLCDPSADARTRVADRLRAEAGWDTTEFHFNTLEEALAGAPGAFDAALILTPNDLHESASLACFAAGKHVLLEKPIALTEEVCDGAASGSYQPPQPLPCSSSTQCVFVGCTVWTAHHRRGPTDWPCADGGGGECRSSGGVFVYLTRKLDSEQRGHLTPTPLRANHCWVPMMCGSHRTHSFGMKSVWPTVC
jgi:hypothetical protein